MLKLERIRQYTDYRKEHRMLTTYNEIQEVSNYNKNMVFHNGVLERKLEITYLLDMNKTIISY